MHTLGDSGGPWVFSPLWITLGTTPGGREASEEQLLMSREQQSVPKLPSLTSPSQASTPTATQA